MSKTDQMSDVTYTARPYNGGVGLRSKLRAKSIGKASALLAGALAASLLAASPASASISALSYYPTFGCTSSSINVAEVPLNQNIGTVRVQAQVLVYNGGQWVTALWSQVASVDTNSMFSELMDPDFNFNAQYNHYFAVWIWTSINGAAWTRYPAQALRDHYSYYVCHTV